MFGDSTFLDELGDGSENDYDLAAQRFLSSSSGQRTVELVSRTNPPPGVVDDLLDDDGDHDDPEQQLVSPLLGNNSDAAASAPRPTTTSNSTQAAATCGVITSSTSSPTTSSSSPPKNLFRSRKVKRNRKNRCIGVGGYPRKAGGSGGGGGGTRTGGGTAGNSSSNRSLGSTGTISLPPEDDSTLPLSPSDVYHHSNNSKTNPHHNRCCTGSNLRCMNCVARALLWLTMVSMTAAVVWYSYELFNHGTDPHLIAWFSAGAFVLMGFPISMWGIVSHLSNYNQPHVQVYVVRILWMVPIYSIESWLAMRFHKRAIYIETLRDLYESYVLYSFLQFLIQVLGGEQALILMLKDKSPTRGVHMWGFQWCMKPWLMGQPVRRTLFHDDTIQLLSHHNPTTSTMNPMHSKRAVKRVHWKSPFFINCKFGVLQYVLLKFLCAVVVLVLEYYGWYKEGDFTYKGGYLYICIITNISQCWALYCLIFFYYATKTELSPIRPVGKFLSVKSLVFFTWWQSVFISGLYQMDMIPHYAYEDWTPEDVAKAIQDYLICIEMFLAAVVHTFVFPHTEYSPQAVEARRRALNQIPMTTKKRLGRHQHQYAYTAAASAASASSLGHHTSSNLWHTAGISRIDDVSKGSSDYNNNNHSNLREFELTNLDSIHDGASSVQTAETWEDQRRAYPQHPNPKYGGTPVLSGIPSNRSFDSSDPHHQFGLHETESWEMAAEDQIMMPALSTPPRNLRNPYASSPHNNSNHNNADQHCHSDEFDSDEYDDGDDQDGTSVVEEGDEDEEDGKGADHFHDDLSDERLELLSAAAAAPTPTRKPGFVSALIDSAIPLDLRDNTVGIVKGDYRIERKTLLHHATTSDQYDLFSQRRPFKRPTNNNITTSSNQSQNSGDR